MIVGDTTNGYESDRAWITVLIKSGNQAKVWIERLAPERSSLNFHYSDPTKKGWHQICWVPVEMRSRYEVPLPPSGPPHFPIKADHGDKEVRVTCQINGFETMTAGNSGSDRYAGSRQTLSFGIKGNLQNPHTIVYFEFWPIDSAQATAQQQQRPAGLASLERRARKKDRRAGGPDRRSDRPDRRSGALTLVKPPAAADTPRLELVSRPAGEELNPENGNIRLHFETGGGNFTLEIPFDQMAETLSHLTSACAAGRKWVDDRKAAASDFRSLLLRPHGAPPEAPRTGADSLAAAEPERASILRTPNSRSS